LYPVAESAGFIFVAVSLLYGVLHWFVGGSIFLAAHCVGFVYLAFHLRGVVLSTIRGEDEVPAWPPVSDLAQAPGTNLFVLLLLWVPLLVSWLFELKFPTAAGIIGAWAFCYVPLGLLAAIVLDETSAVMPSVLFRAIRAAPLDYLLILVFHALTLGAGALAALKFPAALAPVTLYSVLLMARLIGLYYRTHRTAIAWDD
jgi:hypothetical protein